MKLREMLRKDCYMSSIYTAKEYIKRLFDEAEQTIDELETVTVYNQDLGNEEVAIIRRHFRYLKNLYTK